MSEMPPAQRPAPLRVPVVDVATRSSLVAPTPPPEAPQPSVVIQRAVRVISDMPVGVPAASDAPISVRTAPAPASALSDGPIAREAETSPLSTPASEPPTNPRANMPSIPAPPPALTAMARAASEGGFPPVPEPRAAPSESRATPIADPRAPLATETRAINLAAPEPRALVAASLSESYAAVEVEPLEALELAETLDDTLDDTLPEDEHVLEVSVPPPPPAPPEALRRSSPSNDNNDQGDVEITVGEAEEDEDYEEYGQRPSGEFEELEIEPEARAAGGTDHLLSVPPPPPPTRLNIPEPPDLSTLTRTARVQEIRPSKPRSHPWWEVLFDDDYLRTVRPPSPEQIARQCDFLERRLRLKPGATLLDVGCGLGLQVVELCTRGYLGVGLDLSLAMLSRASDEAQGRGMRINFLHSDMRDMNFDGAFDALVCLGTSFGYFDDDTNRKVIERFLRALKPGGLLLLDVVNRDHVIRAQPNLVWFEGDGCVCMEESEFNFFTSRLHVKRTVILDGGKQTETEYALRLYSLHELGQLLQSAGFRVTEVSGREALTGVFFGQESPQMIIVAERRPANDSTGKYPVME
jgi:SAM-dependent methyltransferase